MNRIEHPRTFSSAQIIHNYKNASDLNYFKSPRSETPSLVKIPDGSPFPMNYSASRLDRNALFAINQVFCRQKVSEVRTKYHRPHLTLDKLKADFMKFDHPRAEKYVSDIYDYVLNSVRHDLAPKERIVPMTIGAVAKYVDFPGAKSPGLPYRVLGYRTKRECVDNPAVLYEIRKTWYDLIFKRGHITLPDVACYARTIICPRDKDKVRATWGYPLLMYMGEAQFFYPILGHLKNLDSPFLAYGLEMANGGMSVINDYCSYSPHKVRLMGDWSGFDATLPSWLIRDVFEILSEWIDWSHIRDSTGKVWKAKERETKTRWSILVDYFCNTPIRFSDGTRYMKYGGVPSGSCFTNIIDSIANMIVMRYCIITLTGQFPITDVYLGDDSFIILPKPINLKDLAELADAVFSMNFNHEKSYVTTNDNNVQFLGYLNDRGRPHKLIDTTIASTIYPEHSVQSKLESVSRLIGQAYTCFESDNAMKFFTAARILMKEDNLSKRFVITEMAENSWKFKYLTTIGVEPGSVTIPRFELDAMCLRTLPSHQRKKANRYDRTPESFASFRYSFD